MSRHGKAQELAVWMKIDQPATDAIMAGFESKGGA